MKKGFLNCCIALSIAGMTATAVSHAVRPSNFTPELVQWVKIESDIEGTMIKVSDLDSSLSGCGYHCKVVKLSTTPFSDAGNIHLNFHTTGGCNGKFDMPFWVLSNQLTTHEGVYTAAIEGTYFKTQLVQIKINSSEHEAYAVSVRAT